MLACLLPKHVPHTISVAEMTEMTFLVIIEARKIKRKVWAARFGVLSLN